MQKINRQDISVVISKTKKRWIAWNAVRTENCVAVQGKHNSKKNIIFHVLVWLIHCLELRHFNINTHEQCRWIFLIRILTIQ